MTQPFRIQYGSDFHFELLRHGLIDFRKFLTPSAPYLALAGDIGNPFDPAFQTFLDYVSAGWRHVFYVAGNHEYYKHMKPMCEVQAQIERCFAGYENLHFLHESSPSVYFAEENVAVIGLTLWTHVPAHLESLAAARMNDYVQIRVKDPELRTLTPADTNRFHAADVTRLVAEIEAWSFMKARICIVTHHMPSPLLVRPEYAGDPINCCFASDQRALLGHPAIHCWIYGHTHDAAARVLDGVKTCVNAAGYKGEGVRGFRTDAVVEIDSKPTPTKEEDEEFVMM